MKNKKLFLVTFLTLLLLACAGPAPSNHGQFDVPTYATNRAIVEKMRELFGVGISYQTYYFVKDRDLDEQAGYGPVAVLVPLSNLQNFSGKTFKDYGQKCFVDENKYFKFDGQNLVVKFSATTIDEYFKDYCDSNISDSIVSYILTLTLGDGNNLVTWVLQALPVSTKFKY